jgi:hypothetical protein
MKQERRSVWLKGAICLLVITSGWFVSRPTFAASDSGTCSADVEARQLDFWLGEWTVTFPGAAGSGNSRVYLSLDQCLLVESWDSGTGLKGENMFAYSPDDKAWHGLYADNRGRAHVFEGQVKPGHAEFDGPSHSPKGELMLNRVKLVRLTNNRVEQTWEKSADNGASWKLEFRGDYSRKSP